MASSKTDQWRRCGGDSHWDYNCLPGGAVSSPGAGAWPATKRPFVPGVDGRAAASAAFAAAPLNGQPITYAQARNWLLKGVAKLRGVSVHEAASFFNMRTHSLRAWGASAVAGVLAGIIVSEHAFQIHGRWRSREAMLGYIERQLGSRLAVTQANCY